MEFAPISLIQCDHHKVSEPGTVKLLGSENCLAEWGTNGAASGLNLDSWPMQRLGEDGDGSCNGVAITVIP